MRTTRRRATEMMRRGFIKGDAKSCGGRLVTAGLVVILILQMIAVFFPVAAQRTVQRSATLTPDQRVAHVLSRLTYGARPGDFEKIKAMGVEAFIDQQLDPDSIDNSQVIAKLRKLPSLGMATPVIIEQYTPPKPAPAPSLLPPKSLDDKAAPPKSIAEIGEKQDAGRMPPLPSAMQNEMQKEDAGKMSQQKPEAGETPAYPGAA